MASSVRRNEYFIPGDGIAAEVIASDINRYLGNSAQVRPAFQEGTPGYLVNAYRNLTTAQLDDLRRDTTLWRLEQQQARSEFGESRTSCSRSPVHAQRVLALADAIDHYQDSQTHQHRSDRPSSFEGPGIPASGPPGAPRSAPSDLPSTAPVIGDDVTHLDLPELPDRAPADLSPTTPFISNDLAHLKLPELPRSRHSRAISPDIMPAGGARSSSVPQPHRLHARLGPDLVPLYVPDDAILGLECLATRPSWGSIGTQLTFRLRCRRPIELHLTKAFALALGYRSQGILDRISSDRLFHYYNLRASAPHTGKFMLTRPLEASLSVLLEHASGQVIGSADAGVFHYKPTIHTPLFPPIRRLPSNPPSPDLRPMPSKGVDDAWTRLQHGPINESRRRFANYYQPAPPEPRTIDSQITLPTSGVTPSYSSLPTPGVTSSYSLSDPPTDSGYSSYKSRSRLGEQHQDSAASNTNDSIRDAYSEPDGDETATVVTDGRSVFLSDDRKFIYIKSFSHVICASLEAKGPPRDASAVRDLIQALPRLLKIFCIRIAGSSPDLTQTEASTFVRHYRRYISRSVEEILSTRLKKCDTIKALDLTGATQMSIQEKLRHWELIEPNETLTDVEMDDLSSDESTDANLEDLDLDKYKSALVATDEFNWLVARIQSELRLESSAQADAKRVLQIVSKAMLSALTRIDPKIRRNNPSVMARFEIWWDLPSFLNSQGYEKPLHESLPEVITLTAPSKGGHAQALPCLEYMKQTWPFSGERLLLVFQAALMNPLWLQASSQSSKDAMIMVDLRRNRTVVEVMGSSEDISEVAEQLSWLSCALRCSISDETDVSYCTPEIHVIECGAALAPDMAAIFHIDGAIQRLDQGLTRRDGSTTCWHKLFKSPTIATGFPVLRRHQNEGSVEGLEIPIEMMAFLADTNHLTTVNGQVILKAFSTILTPTKRTGDCIVWHLECNDDGSHISHLDPRLENLSRIETEGLTINDIKAARNFLGWCSVVSRSIGDKNFPIDVAFSQLDSAHCGVTLEKGQLTGGQFLGATLTFAPGNKDRPLRIKSANDSYHQRVHHLLTKSVVFFDVDEAFRRAWLVDGASALLFLTYARLRHEEKHAIGDHFLFQFSEIDQPDDLTDPCLAARVLLNRFNMNIIKEIDSPDGSQNPSETVEASRQCFRHCVDQAYATLDQIIDHHVGMSHNFRGTNRERLDGFDFSELVSGEDPIPLRKIHLKDTARGWVDFARSLNAPILFGKQFGELFAPHETANKLCRRWSQLPPQMDYLAVCTSDLQRLVNKWKAADNRGGPLRVNEDLYWYNPHKCFAPCDCSAASHKHGPLERSTCDRVQVLAGQSFLGSKQAPEPLGDDPRGAVVFGQSDRLRIRWPITGPPQAVREAAVSREDASECSTIAEEQRSMPTRPHPPPTPDRKRRHSSESRESAHRSKRLPSVSNMLRALG